MRQHQLQGAIYCLIATASWGAMFPVMTGALVRIDPFTFTSLRYLIAGAAFLAVLIFRKDGALSTSKESACSPLGYSEARALPVSTS